VAKKVQLPVIGGIRKTIIPGGVTTAGTTIAEIGANTITLAQLAALIAAIESPTTGTIGMTPTAAVNVGPGLSGGGPLLGTIAINLTAPVGAHLLFDGDAGADGDRGPPGINGTTGAQGPIGPPGLQGEDGQDGNDGPPGQQGAQGLTGSAGPQGSPGLQGEDGQDGNDGPPGLQGAQGVTGGAGPQGAAIFLEADPGADGDIGPPGLAGAAGATGAQGPQGAAIFLEADPGADGDIGPPGPAGAAGAQGLTGAQGPLGPAIFLEADPGADGDIGPPGPAGAAGAQGPAGSTGAQGPAGLFFTYDEIYLDEPWPLNVPSAFGAAVFNGPVVINAPYSNSPTTSVFSAALFAPSGITFWVSSTTTGPATIGINGLTASDRSVLGFYMGGVQANRIGSVSAGVFASDAVQGDLVINNVNGGTIRFSAAPNNTALPTQLALNQAGAVGVATANGGYGQPGQVLTSQGANGATTWATLPPDAAIMFEQPYPDDTFFTNATGPAGSQGITGAQGPIGPNAGILYEPIYPEDPITIGRSPVLGPTSVVGPLSVPISPLLSTITRAFTGLANFLSAATTRNSVTLSAEAGLTVTCNETGWYAVDCFLEFFEATAGTGGIQWDFNAGSATIANPSFAVNGFSTAAFSNAGITSISTATGIATIGTAVGTPSWAKVSGTIQVTATGTFGVRWAQNTLLAVDPTSMAIGSRIILTKIG
jgi:Collagen triple helix repeat (20 copies)